MRQVVEAGGPPRVLQAPNREGPDVVVLAWPAAIPDPLEHRVRWL